MTTESRNPHDSRPRQPWRTGFCDRSSSWAEPYAGVLAAVKRDDRNENPDGRRDLFWRHESGRGHTFRQPSQNLPGTHNMGIGMGGKGCGHQPARRLSRVPVPVESLESAPGSGPSNSGCSGRRAMSVNRNAPPCTASNCPYRCRRQGVPQPSFFGMTRVSARHAFT